MAKKLTTECYVSFARGNRRTAYEYIKISKLRFRISLCIFYEQYRYSQTNRTLFLYWNIGGLRHHSFRYWCSQKAATSFGMSHCNLIVNPLWPGDVVWRHRSGSTLAQVMACCLTWTILTYIQRGPMTITWNDITQPTINKINSKITYIDFLPGDNELRWVIEKIHSLFN